MYYITGTWRSGTANFSCVEKIRGSVWFSHAIHFLQNVRTQLKSAVYCILLISAPFERSIGSMWFVCAIGMTARTNHTLPTFVTGHHSQVLGIMDIMLNRAHLFFKRGAGGLIFTTCDSYSLNNVVHIIIPNFLLAKKVANFIPHTFLL